MHKQLVAGFTCLQSNFIGTNFADFCSNLGVRGLFSSPFVSYWVHIDWLAPCYLMGAGNPTISQKTETQVRAASPGSPTVIGFGERHRHPWSLKEKISLWDSKDTVSVAQSFV